MFQSIFPLTTYFTLNFPKFLSSQFSACLTIFSINNEKFTILKFLFSPALRGTSKERKRHSLLLLKPLSFQIAILHHALAAPFLLHFFTHAHVALLPRLSLNFSTVAPVSPHPPSLFIVILMCSWQLNTPTTCFPYIPWEPITIHPVPYIEVQPPVLSILLELLALGDKTDRLSQNVSKQLPKDQANVL